MITVGVCAIIRMLFSVLPFTSYTLRIGFSQFIPSVLVAYARAVYKMNKDGITGAKTVLDVPPIYLSSKSRDELISTLL